MALLRYAETLHGWYRLPVAEHTHFNGHGKEPAIGWRLVERDPKLFRRGLIAPRPVNLEGAGLVEPLLKEPPELLP